MAKNDNLQDFLTDIADAIREKKGTTDKINPQDFATEIANLSSGDDSGSGSGSGSGNLSLAYFYIDRSTTDSYAFDNVVADYYGVLYGYAFNGHNIISAKYVLETISIQITDVSYFAVIDGAIPQINIDTNAMEDINNANQIRESIKSMSSTQCHIREITKEQFYNLEA